MYKYFKLLAGDGWARTGAKFRPLRSKHEGTDKSATHAASGGVVAARESVYDECCLQCGARCCKSEQLACRKCQHQEGVAAGNAESADMNKSLFSSLLSLVRREAVFANESGRLEISEGDDYIVTAPPTTALAALKVCLHLCVIRRLCSASVYPDPAD